MTQAILTGGCQCGAVRYRVRGPARDNYHCHCGMCRRCHGALFGTFSNWEEENFTLEKGADNLQNFDTSPDGHRKFCRTCGCPVFGIDERQPGIVIVSTATLDGGADPGNRERTLRHIFVGSKVPWYEITDNLPQHEEFSPGVTD